MKTTHKIIIIIVSLYPMIIIHELMKEFPDYAMIVTLLISIPINIGIVLGIYSVINKIRKKISTDRQHE
ncbi:MAG TPA: hypothetical protein VFN17_05200 [Nitrosarchaeum sp.]|nr:hypothetical protein [Nitrosarchaeum sp.]